MTFIIPIHFIENVEIQICYENKWIYLISGKKYDVLTFKSQPYLWSFHFKMSEIFYEVFFAASHLSPLVI